MGLLEGSGLRVVGTPGCRLSASPCPQRRAYFRLWNAALGGFLSVPDRVEDMKAGRVVVSEPRAGGSCVWYYEEGLLKNQVKIPELALLSSRFATLLCKVSAQLDPRCMEEVENAASFIFLMLNLPKPSI